MDIRDIKKLVLEGETDILEFKKKANFPEKIVKEIVAFANTRGGRLLIGVDDDGTVTGVKNYEEDIYSLNEAITNYCIPSIKYQLDVVKMNEKRAVLHYNIYESKDKPHYVKDDYQGKNRKSYLRLADRSIQASREMVEILKKRQRSKNIKVNFGEKERILMNYLGEHEKITLKTFSEIADIKRSIASRTLIWLVSANILDIEAREDEDIFTQKMP
ncbi:MAG: ATP-binding protein [Cyclobacteriaceae bacterium]|jgi:predicted HTH transcriptional regulator